MMIEDLLRKSSLKVTKQRYLILNIIVESKKPLTADEIYNILEEKKVNINLSTVYRTLNILSEKNVLIKILKLDGIASYQLNDSSHNHYITCNKCQSSVLIDNCPIRKLNDKISIETGYEVTGHSLQITGLCQDCKYKSK